MANINFKQALAGYLSTLGTTGTTGDLNGFVAYLEGLSAAAPSKGHSGKRPGEGTITGRVWGICDALAASHPGKVVTRSEVIQKGHTEQGINWHTVTTQFQAWAAVHQPKQVAPVAAPQAAVPTQVAPTASTPVLVDPSGNPVTSAA